jgi:hypothetical protein
MRIPSKLQAIVSTQRGGRLCYLTPSDDGGFKSRQKTGMAWAGKDYELVDINNDPVEGFKLIGNIHRTYFGGGNVVWRIEDPRGFQLEIQSGNLDAIISSSVIENGTIRGACVYARDGSVNALVPCDSPEYIASIEETQRLNQKASKSDFVAGCIVELKTGKKYVYLGKFNMIGKYSWQGERDRAYSHGYSRSYYHHSEVGFKQAYRHVFVPLETSGNQRTSKYEYEIIASPHVSKVFDLQHPTKFQSDLQYFYDDVKEGKFDIGASYTKSCKVLAISKKPIDLTSIKITSNELSSHELADEIEISNMRLTLGKTKILAFVNDAWDQSIVMKKDRTFILQCNQDHAGMYYVSLKHSVGVDDIVKSKNGGNAIPTSVPFIVSSVLSDEYNPLLSDPNAKINSSGYYNKSTTPFSKISDKRFSVRDDAVAHATASLTEVRKYILKTARAYEITASFTSDDGSNVSVSLI